MGNPYICGFKKKNWMIKFWGQQTQPDRSVCDEPCVALSNRWPLSSAASQGRPSCKGWGQQHEICAVRLGRSHSTHCQQRDWGGFGEGQGIIHWDLLLIHQRAGRRYHTAGRRPLPVLLLKRSLGCVCVKLEHRCQTLACGPNLAHSVIILRYTTRTANMSNPSISCCNFGTSISTWCALTYFFIYFTITQYDSIHCIALSLACFMFRLMQDRFWPIQKDSLFCLEQDFFYEY